VTQLYFAYGSNLHPLRLTGRAPSSVFVGVARLPDYGLRFHKRAADGSGKCDVIPATGDTVYGGLFRLDARDLPRLDAAEEGYVRVVVRVRLAAEAVEAVTYRARPERVAPALLPYRWYRDLVVAGARHRGLPPAYVVALEAIAVQNDPDANRARRMEGLLSWPSS
jgi:gamma-glutamylcyclotransferase